MPKIDDSLNLTINIKWLAQLVVLIGSMVAAWYSLRMSLSTTMIEVEDLRSKTESQYGDLHSRLQIIESARNEQLSEMNRSLWQKTFGKYE